MKSSKSKLLTCFSEEQANCLLEVFGKKKAEPKTDGVNETVAFFIDEYFRLYGTKYAITKKEIGLLKTLRATFSKEKAEELILTYFEMKDSFFISRRHDIFTMHCNIAKISHFQQTRKVITKAQLKQIDDMENYNEILNAIDRGEI